MMEGLQVAQRSAQSAGRAEILPMEVLLALLEQEDGVLAAVLQKAGADPSRLAKTLTEQLARQPRQHGGVAGSPGIGAARTPAMRTVTYFLIVVSLLL